MTATSTYPRTNSPDRIPFVYIVGWSEEGVYYIGSRTARGCKPSDIGTTYFTSSKVVRKKWEESPPDIIRVLMTFATKEAAIEFEHTALLNLEAHRTPQLLNQCVSGRKFFLAHGHSAKAKAKMSASRQNVSDETRLKLSAARKGRSPWNKGATGQIHSEETRAKMSAAHKGKPKLDSTKAKLSAAHKGRTISDETRAKISAAGKGREPWNKGKAVRPHSEETRAKMSAAHKRRKALNSTSPTEQST